MPIYEKRIVDLAFKHKDMLMFIFISVLALVIRLCLLDFQSYDFNNFLLPWFEEIKRNGGLQALHNQVGNYGITYQFLIALATYIPVKPIIMYKVLSIFFDYTLAFAGAKLAKQISSNSSMELFIITYSIILFVPTVIMNSGLWGQCDSIYCSFILLSLLEIMKDKKVMGFILLGIAFAFKLQTIFVLPFFLLLYVKRRDFSILYFGISLISFYICCLPGILMGRKWNAPFLIYSGQTNETRINLFYPNLSGTLIRLNNGNMYNYKIMVHFLILLTVAVLAVGGYYLITRYKNTWDNSQMLLYTTWVVWSCVMFLPNMHDRYGYLVDILFIILAINFPIFWVNAMLCILESWFTYTNAMFAVNINMIILSFLAMVNYCGFTMVLFTSSYRTNLNINNVIKRALK